MSLHNFLELLNLPLLVSGVWQNLYKRHGIHYDTILAEEDRQCLYYFEENEPF